MKAKITDLSPAYKVGPGKDGKEHFQRDVTCYFRGRQYVISLPNPPGDLVSLKKAVRAIARLHLRTVIEDIQDVRHRVVGDEFDVT